MESVNNFTLSPVFSSLLKWLMDCGILGKNLKLAGVFFFQVSTWSMPGEL